MIKRALIEGNISTNNFAQELLYKLRSVLRTFCSSSCLCVICHCNSIVNNSYSFLQISIYYQCDCATPMMKITTADNINLRIDTNSPLQILLCFHRKNNNTEFTNIPAEVFINIRILFYGRCHCKC